MRRTITLVAAAFLAVSAIAVPAVAATDIENKVSAKLVEVFGNEGKAIRVAVVDGKATLVGHVVERSTQELAEEVALYFPEVRKVDNQLKADKDSSLLGGQLGDEGADANLERQVKNALEAEIGDHAKKIEVEAADGVVSIRGNVPDEARLNYARKAPGKVKGVKKTIDLLRVSK